MLRAEMDRRVAEAGIGVTAGEARALAHAARAGPVRQKVLAERMGVEPMTLRTYVERLEAIVPAMSASAIPCWIAWRKLPQAEPPPPAALRESIEEEARIEASIAAQ